MKLTGIIKRDGEAMLDRALKDLAACEAQIAALQEERQSKLLDAPVSEIDAIDLKISDLHRQANVYRDRVSMWEKFVAQQQAAQAKRDYAAACDRLARPVGEREQALTKLARLLDETGAAAREFAAKDRAVINAWPSGVDWPVRVYVPGYLGTAWIGERIAGVLGPDLVGHYTRKPPNASEWFTRLCELHGSGIVATGAEQGVTLLEALRTAHDPPAPSATADNEEAAA